MTISLRTLSLTGLLLGITVSAHAALNSASLAHLQTLEQSSAVAGELIYQGDTYALEGAGSQPLFNYERRVLDTSSGLTAAHLTRNPQGQLIVVETAEVGPDYGLRRFTTINQQSDFSGSVEVSADGQHLHYSLRDAGEDSVADEQVDLPVISGPSMHGFILQHWSQLKAGERIPVRFVVLQEMQTYGFDLRFEQEIDGQTVFSLTPSSFFIRLALKPLRVVFDSSTKTLVRYEGRVPPKQALDGALRDLDARVEYKSITPSYR